MDWLLGAGCGGADDGGGGEEGCRGGGLRFAGGGGGGVATGEGGGRAARGGTSSSARPGGGGGAADGAEGTAGGGGGRCRPGVMVGRGWGSSFTATSSPKMPDELVGVWVGGSAAGRGSGTDAKGERGARWGGGLGRGCGGWLGLAVPLGETEAVPLGETEAVPLGETKAGLRAESAGWAPGSGAAGLRGLSGSRAAGAAAGPCAPCGAGLRCEPAKGATAFDAAAIGSCASALGGSGLASSGAGRGGGGIGWSSRTRPRWMARAWPPGAPNVSSAKSSSADELCCKGRMAAAVASRGAAGVRVCRRESGASEGRSRQSWRRRGRKARWPVPCACCQGAVQRRAARGSARSTRAAQTSEF
jgi:hypothetical protein